MIDIFIIVEYIKRDVIKVGFYDTASDLRYKKYINILFYCCDFGGWEGPYRIVMRTSNLLDILSMYEFTSYIIKVRIIPTYLLFMMIPYNSNT